MSIIARLGVWLGINTSEFVKGLDDATKKTREFEKNQKQAIKNAQKAQEEFMAFAARGLAGVAAAALAVGKAFQYADQIEDTAKAFDTTTAAMLTMQAAFVSAGGDAEMAGGALQKLAIAQQGAIDGSDALRESFEKLNISGKEVEKLNLQQLFDLVAKELSNVESATQRVALQTDLLGKAVKGTNWKDFVDNYKKLEDPALAAAIQENAKAWGNIEQFFKEIYYYAQKSVAPIASIVNNVAELIKSMNSAPKPGALDFGFFGGVDPGAAAAGATSYAYVPQASTVASTEAAPKDIGKGGYSTQTSKQQSAAKAAAEEEKRRQEARRALELEIKLIKEKADIADKMFAIDAKGITLGEAAIAQEKMRLNLASDLAQIRNDAAKERNKEKAQVDLINAKEKAAIDARIKQFNNEDSLRQKALAHQHQIAMQNLDIEYEKQNNTNNAEYQATYDLLSLEQKKFDIGENAYELRKLEIEASNQLAKAGAQYSNTLIDIERSYDLSAKSAEDAAVRQKNMQLADQQYQQEKNRIIAIQEARSTILAQQQERQHKITIRAIKDEMMSKELALKLQTQNEIQLISLERERFELGSAGYALKKIDIDAAQQIKKIEFDRSEKIKEINKQFELSAKTAEDIELQTTNTTAALLEELLAVDAIVKLQKERKTATKEQFDLEDKMFALDIAQQKGREIANIQANLKVEKERLELESNRYLMSTNQYNLSNLALENVLRLAEAEKKYNDQMKEAEYEMQRQGGGQRAREQYEQRIKSIEQIRDTELDAINQINNARQQNLEKEIERQKSFVEGWEYAARQFRENAENAFNRGAAAFQSVMSSMDSAISNFVETGKFKFEDFALGIIRDLIRIEMQAQASMLFQSMVGFFNPASPAATPANAVVAFQKRASGGYIDAPTIVGENGAELFIPNMPGTVIPNGSWQQAAANMNKGGFTNNGTYIANMSAIDTQSATQFLASNKNTIWAAYQSANRSVPITR